ncbi:MAG: M23 family metallopeptidase [Chloroflexi bacterium]|nr:M23 family metallopeptidase [Chloroflexota bacterium]
MRRFQVVSVVLVILVGLTAIAFARPANAQPHAQDASSHMFVIVQPSTEIQQGRSALLRVQILDGSQPKEVQATFLGHVIYLYPSVDGDWVGFLGVDMEAPRGTQPVEIFYNDTDGVQQTFTQEVSVVWGAFTYQDIGLPYALEPLLDPEINREEEETLLRAMNRTTPEKFFTSFITPVRDIVISEFGGIRNYNNDAFTGRHTGTDYMATTGDPVAAAADGRVVFIAHLPIHGNHIIIDHGWGILTGYSHLSEIQVVPGQLVRQGQTIGLVGATGRVQGAHLHFEVMVNGVWVDPPQFLTLPLPASLPNP